MGNFLGTGGGRGHKTKQQHDNTRLSVDHSNSSTQFQTLLSVDSLQIYRRMFWSSRHETDTASLSSDVDCGGSAMATLANKQVGGDEEDVYEDFVSHVHLI